MMFPLVIGIVNYPIIGSGPSGAQTSSAVKKSGEVMSLMENKLVANTSRIIFIVAELFHTK